MAGGAHASDQGILLCPAFPPLLTLAAPHSALSRGGDHSLCQRRSSGGHCQALTPGVSQAQDKPRLPRHGADAPEMVPKVPTGALTLKAQASPTASAAQQTGKRLGQPGHRRDPKKLLEVPGRRSTQDSQAGRKVCVCGGGVPQQLRTKWKGSKNLCPGPLPRWAQVRKSQACGKGEGGWAGVLGQSAGKEMPNRGSNGKPGILRGRKGAGTTGST